MSKEERQARKDDAAMRKALDLVRAHGPVVDRLTQMGHLKAAKNVEDKGGRYDSPEVRTDHRRNRSGGGQER